MSALQRKLGPLRVRIGSANGAKLEAVRIALAPFFRPLDLHACPVESGVAAQPVGFEEILAGARTRARSAFRAGVCDLSAGIEDGLVPVPDTTTGYMNVGCCALYDGERASLGLSAGFEYPIACVGSAISDRVPVGDTFDAIFGAPEGWPDPGRGAGNIGRLSGGALTRAQYGAQAVTCALVRLLHAELYDGVG